MALIVLRPFAESREWWQVSRIAPALLTFEAEVLEAFDYIVNGIAGGREPGAPTEPVVGDELPALTEPVVATEPEALIEPVGDEPGASTEPAADEPEAQ